MNTISPTSDIANVKVRSVVAGLNTASELKVSSMRAAHRAAAG
jgi:hypothetical protein